MRLIDAPCYKCKERHLACHGSCETYSSYLAARHRQYKHRIAQATIASYFVERQHRITMVELHKKGELHDESL